MMDQEHEYEMRFPPACDAQIAELAQLTGQAPPEVAVECGRAGPRGQGDGAATGGNTDAPATRHREEQRMSVIEEFDEATALRLFAELEKHPVQLNLQGYNAWVLLSGIQLCCRHPEISPGLKGRLERMGREIQKAYDDSPWISTLAEAGWDPSQDVPRESR